MFFYVLVCFCTLYSAIALMYIFKDKHFTLGVFVPKVGYHVALNNVHSGSWFVHECENNYPCLAAGGSPSLHGPVTLKLASVR